MLRKDVVVFFFTILLVFFSPAVILAADRTLNTTTHLMARKNEHSAIDNALSLQEHAMLSKTIALFCMSNSPESFNKVAAIEYAAIIKSSLNTSKGYLAKIEAETDLAQFDKPIYMAIGDLFAAIGQHHRLLSAELAKMNPDIRVVQLETAIIHNGLLNAVSLHSGINKRTRMQPSLTSGKDR